MERVYFTTSEWAVNSRDLYVRDIDSLEESPSRLPVRFANELYAAGESGQGYTAFVLEFRDGTRQAYLVGGLLDFLEYPEGKGPEDVVRALPHEGRSKWVHKGHHGEYSVCLVAELPEHRFDTPRSS